MAQIIYVALSRVSHLYCLHVTRMKPLYYDYGYSTNMRNIYSIRIMYVHRRNVNMICCGFSPIQISQTQGNEYADTRQVLSLDKTSWNMTDKGDICIMWYVQCFSSMHLMGIVVTTRLIREIQITVFTVQICVFMAFISPRGLVCGSCMLWYYLSKR